MIAPAPTAIDPRAEDARLAPGTLRGKALHACLAGAVNGAEIAAPEGMIMSARAFHRGIAADAASVLAAGSNTVPSSAIDRQALARLPTPVRAYLELALGERGTAPRNLRLRHRGRFKPSLEGPWRSIVGAQYYGADPPGFIWWGRLKIAPGVWIDARDRSLHGAGSMLVALESTFQLMDRSGPELDQGALLRLLSELVLLPAVLADARYVTWSPIDAVSARATLALEGRSVSGVFELDEQGFPRRFSAQRYRDGGRGPAVLAPWSGDYGEYRRVAGLMIPHRLRGYWHENERALQYVDFDLTTVEYDVDEPFVS